MLPGGIYIAVITGTPHGARRTVGSQIDPVEAFYRQRFADAVRLAHLLTGDPSIAEDLAQDAFERVRPRFDGLSSPWAYLRAAVVNACRLPPPLPPPGRRPGSQDRPPR
jgi:hypothetical protein